MKNIKFLILMSIFLSAILTSIQADNQKSLADLYKGGQVRFVPELILDDNSMPEDIFFESPSYITVDTKGNIYIFDYIANNIKKFDASGKFIKIIGRKGQGPGEFGRPSQATCANNRLIVWEMRNWRLCALTLDSEYVRGKKLASRREWLQNMRSLRNGDVVIGMETMFFSELDKPQEYTIQIFSPDLEQKKSIYSYEFLAK